MRKTLLFLIAFTLCAVARAADTKPAEEVFLRYWAAFAKGDYVRAAAEVLPSDLEEAKTALLPVFIAAQAKPAADLQEMTKLFFGRTVGKARETMSAVDVYVGLMRLVAATDPAFTEAVKDAKVEIIIAREPGPDLVEVHYQMIIRGDSDTDSETLARKNGRWWLKLNAEAKEIAEQLKEKLK